MDKFLMENLSIRLFQFKVGRGKGFSFIDLSLAHEGL